MKPFELYNRRKELISKGMGSPLLKRGASTLLVKGLGLPLSFLLQVILARVMPVEEYGVYAFAVSWLAILTLIVPLGFNFSYLRFIPQYRVQGQWSYLKGILKQSNALVFLFSLMAACICAGISIIFIEDKSLQLTFLIMSLLLPFRGLNKLRQAALKGLKSTFWGLFPEMVARPVLLAGSAGILFLAVSRPLEASSVMILNGAVMVILLIMGTLILQKKLPSTVKEEKSASVDTRHWLSVSLPLLMASGLAIVFNKIDILMVGFIAGKEATAFYNVASRTAMLLTLFSSTAIAVISPNVAELYHSGTVKELRRKLKFASGATALSTIIVAVPFFLFGSLILGIFGGDYIEGYPALLILAATHVLGSCFFTIGLFLRVTGRQQVIAWVMASSVILNILFNALLIPFFGITGAAVGSALARIFSVIIQLFYARKYTELMPSKIS